MGILSMIRRKKPADLSFLTNSIYDVGPGKITPTDYRGQVASFTDTVYSCVNMNSTAVASVPLCLYVKKAPGRKFRYSQTRAIAPMQLKYLRATKGIDEAEEITEHPFIELMDNVNGMMNGYDLKELTTIYLDLTGNCYWYTPLNNLGIPSEIWVLPVEYMRVIPDSKKGIAGYVFKRGTEEIRYDENEIVHFKYISPQSEYYGVGPLMGCIDSYTLKVIMNRYEKAMLENMGRPDMLVKVKQKLTQELKERIQGMWGQLHGGYRRAGKVAVLSGDEIEVQQLGFPPREMAYMQGRKYLREDIANAMSVPIAMLTSESSNRAVAEAALYQHALLAVKPRCTRLQEKLNEKLLPKYDSNIFCAFENPVPEDKEFMLKERQTNITTGFSTIDEERGIAGREPIGIDVPLISSTLVPYTGIPQDTEAMVEAISNVVASKIMRQIYAK